MKIVFRKISAGRKLMRFKTMKNVKPIFGKRYEALGLPDTDFLSLIII